jgi:hypothetical protein
MNKTEDKEVAAADRLVADESLEDTDLTESKPIKTNIMSITQRIILGLALIGAFLGVLDTSIVYTGTVKMAAQLQLNANALS